MNLKSKWGAVAGAVVITGAVLTAGIALAESSNSGAAASPSATQAPSKDRTNWLDEAVKSGKLTQAEADVMKQLDDLRKSAMEKLQADEKAIIDQAVKDGKLTQDQADKLSKHPGPMGGPMDGGRGGRDHGGPGPMGKGRQPMTQEQLKAKLDEEVKAGKLTQAQEDEMLKKFAQRQAEHAQALQSQQSQSTQGQ